MALFCLINKCHATNKNGKINAASHYEYITREGHFSGKDGVHEDLIYKETGNVPPCYDNAKDFWKSSMDYGRKNGRAYREIILGLQEEFTIQQNIEIIHDFMDYFGISKEHVYSFAIHSNPASFDKSHQNIHCHLMFNEKIIDKRNWKNETKENFFKRYSTNEKGEITGGAKTDRYFSKKESIQDMRIYWEKINNNMFKKLGIDTQISHKTLQEQKSDLEKKGRFEEAEMFNRIPVEHLGPYYKKPENKEKILELAHRIENNYNDNTEEKENEIEKKIQELETKRKNAEKLSEQERLQAIEQHKMMIFAMDIVIRKTAKKIQHERELKNLKKLEKMNKIINKYNSEEINYTITVNDVYTALDNQEKQWIKKQNELNAKIKEQQNTIITDENKKIIIFDALSDGKHIQLTKKYIQLDQQIEKLETKYKEENNIIRKQDIFEKQKDFIEEKKHIEKQIINIEKNIENQPTEKKQEILDEIEKQNYQTRKKIKELAQKAKLANNTSVFFHAKKLALKNQLAADKILFTSKIPKMLFSNAKINGKKEIKDFDTAEYQGKIYAIINKPKIFVYGKKQVLQTVQIGDDVTKNKAYIHLIEAQIQIKKLPSGKTFTYYEITSAKKTKKTINLYATDNKENLNLNKKNNIPDHNLAKINQTFQNIVKQVINSKTNNFGKLWNNDEKLEINEMAKEDQNIKNWAKTMKETYTRSM